MAHRNVAAAELIHIRARGRILTTAALSLYGLLSLSFLLLSYGVAVQVTSITALNVPGVPTSTSFYSPHHRAARYI